MSRYKGILVVFLAIAFVFVGMVLPVRADMEEWLPDSDSWLGKQLKRILDPFLTFVKQFIDTVIGTIQKAVEEVVKFFQPIWESCKVFIETATKFFSDIWQWHLEVLVGFYSWSGETIIEFYDWWTSTIEVFQTWLLDWGEYLLGLVWEQFLQFLDWLVGLFVELFEWFLDMFPEIELPQGFNTGMNYFMSYGNLLDQIAPLTETLICLAVFFTVWLIAIVYSWIKTFIPFV